MDCFSVPEQVTEGELSNMQVRSPPPTPSFLGENEINKQWMVHSPRAPHPISCMAASNGLLGVSFYWHGTKQVPRARWLDSPPQTRPVDKSKQNAPAELRDIVMLGWNEEVQWRGEGLRAQLHGAAAALRPSAHGAGESWKNFILQTQGIAGKVTSTALFSSTLILQARSRPLNWARFISRFLGGICTWLEKTLLIVSVQVRRSIRSRLVRAVLCWYRTCNGLTNQTYFLN